MKTTTPISRSEPAMRGFWVPVGTGSYRVLVSPDPIADGEGGRYRYDIDPEDAVIWIDPGVPLAELPQVIADAVASAWMDLAEGRVI